MKQPQNEPRKDCPRCGLQNQPFGTNKTRSDGLAAYCKACMRKSRKDCNAQPIDWMAVNKRRRANAAYRDKERKRANERDKERRKTEVAYIKQRSASNKKWRTTGDVQAKRERRTARQRKYRKLIMIRAWEKIKILSFSLVIQRQADRI